MSAEDFQAKVDETLAPIVDLLRPVVEGIEGGVASTRNHYGDYMGILMTAPRTDDRKIMAMALIKAGANVQGVRDALAQVT